MNKQVLLKDFFSDSGSTDFIIVDRNWFSTSTKLDKIGLYPDDGKTKDEGIGEVEVSAEMHDPGYRTGLIRYPTSWAMATVLSTITKSFAFENNKNVQNRSEKSFLSAMSSRRTTPM